MLTSTLRDPTQLRQRQCATTTNIPFFYGSSEERSRFGQKSTARDYRILPIFLCCVMFEWKKLKFLLLIRRKDQICTKKVQLGTRGFCTYIFELLTTPYVMFEWKKLKFLFLIRRKEQIQTKKVQLRTRGFCPYFCAV